MSQVIERERGYLSQQSQKPKPDYAHPATTKYFEAIMAGLSDKSQTYWFDEHR